MRKLLFFIPVLYLTLFAHQPYMLLKVEKPVDSITEEAFLKMNPDVQAIDEEGRLEVIAHSDEVEKFRSLGLKVEVEIEDMEKYYAECIKGPTDFGNYYTYSESNSILDSLYNDYPSIITERIDLGYTTWDGNKIWAVKISDNPGVEEGEPEVLITGVHHAREPITCNVAVEVVRKLCKEYSTDEEIKFLVDNREIWVVPVMNPDGYLYNEQQSPGGGGMWRKNRRDNGGGDYGVDPNRNYAYEWGYDNSGSSGDPSSETYRGPSAFSEPCTQAMRDLMNDHEFVTNVDMHSYGNYILFPWCYDTYYTTDDSLYRELSKDMQALAAVPDGQTYTYGIPPDVLYACNGVSDDWEYGEQTSKPKIYSFTFEIGEQFWQESEIQTHLEEAVPMCMYLIKIAGPWIAFADYTIDDGGGNGKLDAGETVDMVVTLENKGLSGTSMDSVNAYLSTDDNYITVQSDSGYFGNIPQGGSAQNTGSPFVVEAHDLTPEGHEVKFTLNVRGSGNYDAATTFNLTVGDEPPPFAIFEDDFEYGGGIDSFPEYWDVTGNWQRTADDYNSPTHSAYSGDVSDNATYLTLKNSIDLSSFSSPQLFFWHTYDFDSGIFMDEASVNISTDGGSSWSDLWVYDWSSGDALPWTQESYDLSSYTTDNVKIRFTIDGYSFFQNYTDWFVDDFVVGMPADNEPPYFEGTTEWKDTLFTGPYPVESYVTDDSEIDSVYLYYRVNSGSWDNINMSLQKDGTYGASIPAQNSGDVIDYYIWGRDKWIQPNEGTDPVGAPGYGYYSFTVQAVGIEDDKADRISFQNLSGNPVTGSLKLRFGIPQRTDVSLSVYDLMGRQVKRIVNSKLNPGLYNVSWKGNDNRGKSVSSGVYFLKFRAGESGSFKRTEKFIFMR